jgi:hypothetical protein
MNDLRMLYWKVCSELCSPITLHSRILAVLNR